MLKGLYTAACGMSTQLRRQDIISNNLANVDTLGFKKDSLIIGSFKDFLVSRIDDEQDKGFRPLLGSISLGSKGVEVFTDFSQGRMKPTGRQLDFAIEGKGFFVLETPFGERYTRAGDFILDSRGFLVTSQGYRVMGENGPIQIDSPNFYFTSKGELVVDGNIVNRFLIVDIPKEGLYKQGESLFGARGEVVNPLSNYNVAQGFLEDSNVNVVKEMVDMISGLRLYEANQRSIIIQDQSLERLINQAFRD